MKIASVEIVGIAPYSPGRHVDVPKLEKESPDDYEKRTWRERCNADEEGKLFIPPMAFKNALDSVASLLNEKIPGKRNQTWTKQFKVGVLPGPEVVYISNGDGKVVSKDKVSSEWLFVPSDGKKGGGTRVSRCFPFVPTPWKCNAEFIIVNDTITKDVFLHYIMNAGNLIGLGRFRPERGGYYGRFRVTEKAFKWGDDRK